MTEAFEIAMQAGRNMVPVSGHMPTRVATHSLWANWKAWQRGTCPQIRRHGREMIYWTSQHHPDSIVRETAAGMLHSGDRRHH